MKKKERRVAVVETNKLVLSWNLDLGFRWGVGSLLIADRGREIGWMGFRIDDPGNEIRGKFDWWSRKSLVLQSIDTRQKKRAVSP
jgi:hypothetical protein